LGTLLLKFVLITSKIIREKQIFVEEFVQKKIPALSPAVIGLPKIDFWYWSKYFIDIYKTCPYRCSYCNTRRGFRKNGLLFSYDLPAENQTVGLGLLTDVYHPDLQMNSSVTDILKVLYRGGYAVTIQTKSDAILQDMELLKKFAQRDRIRVTFTILTVDEELSSRLEEEAPPPGRRFKALKKLNEAGIPAGIAVIPIIPDINDSDTDLTVLVKNAKQSGAGWLLFSRFHPTSPFISDPEWEKAAKILTDQPTVTARYRRIKNTIIQLLAAVTITMRIPRMHRGPLDKKFSSDTVSEHLFNISYLYELLDEHLDAARYLNAAYEINELQQSLKTIVFKKNHGYIKWINPEIETVIEEHLYRGTSSVYSTAYNRVLTECVNG
jgi:pyruvate-formate lyase-activating enzyme